MPHMLRSIKAAMFAKDAEISPHEYEMMVDLLMPVIAEEEDLRTAYTRLGLAFMFVCDHSRHHAVIINETLQMLEGGMDDAWKMKMAKMTARFVIDTIAERTSDQNRPQGETQPR